MKPLRILAVLALCVLALGASTALYGQANAASMVPGVSYLTTVTNANTGAFSSRSVITFHSDHSMSVIDSGQGGPGVQFSSQQGPWISVPGNALAARTLDFSFPSAGIAVVDYHINILPADQISGTITLTVFALTDNPLGGGGTVVGTFNFTGTKITVP